MKNVLLNFIQGKNIADSLDMEIYLSSLSKFKAFDKILFANYITDAQTAMLSKYYDQIVNVPDRDYPVVGYKVYHDWLCEHAMHYEYAMHCDMRDVIIQKDPFEFMRNMPDKDLFLCAEGMKISESECNRIWHDWFLTTVSFNKHKYDDSEVLNGGTYGGKLSAILLFTQMVLIGMNRLTMRPAVMPDQVVLGFLERQLKINPKVNICHPYRDTFACTGEAIKRDNIEIYFDGTHVTNKDGEPYCIFHQWDRTELAKHFQNKELNTLRFSL